MVPPIIIFILILSLLIFIHELGHFAMARRFKIDVEEFGIGLPPRIWGKKIKETIWSINWLPLGGFVKIKGEDFEGYDSKDTGNFMNKKPWQKFLVLFAGVFMNFLLAVTIFYFLLSANSWLSSPLLLVDDYKFKFGEKQIVSNVITFISEDSPASEAGVDFADQIYNMSYQNEKVFPQTVDDIRDFVDGKEGKEITIKTRNINTEYESEYKITPIYNEELNQAALGVALENAVRLNYSSNSDRPWAGFMHSINIADYSFYMIKNLIVSSFQERDISVASQGISGPVGIFGVIKSILETGGNRVVFAIFDLVALFSLSLAIMNLLPIPALDGGRIVFVIVEWITGKKPSSRLEARAHQIGYGLLILLLILVSIKDVIQFF